MKDAQRPVIVEKASACEGQKLGAGAALVQLPVKERGHGFADRLFLEGRRAPAEGLKQRGARLDALISEDRLDARRDRARPTGMKHQILPHCLEGCGPQVRVFRRSRIQERGLQLLRLG